MATPTRLSILEYSMTSYRPDMEYVDGSLVKRNVGKYEHARLQALLAAWIAAEILRVPGTLISVDLLRLFADLDEN